MEVKVKLFADVGLPKYANVGDAGADLVSSENVVIMPHQRKVVKTGIAIELPNGYAAFIHPRSGLAVNSGLTIVNAPGTIDSAYRGEIMIPLLNTDLENKIFIKKGDRIAQMVIQKVENVSFVKADVLSETIRQDKGFGSTGK